MESFYFLFLYQLRVWTSGVTWDWEEFLAPLTSLLHENKTKALLGSSFTWKHRRKFAVLNFLFVGWRWSEPTQCGAHCLPEQKDRWFTRAIGLLRDPHNSVRPSWPWRTKGNIVPLIPLSTSGESSKHGYWTPRLVHQSSTFNYSVISRESLWNF